MLITKREAFARGFWKGLGAPAALFAGPQVSVEYEDTPEAGDISKYFRAAGGYISSAVSRYAEEST
jgi:hypothetical protein